MIYIKLLQLRHKLRKRRGTRREALRYAEFLVPDVGGNAIWERLLLGSFALALVGGYGVLLLTYDLPAQAQSVIPEVTKTTPILVPSSRISIKGYRRRQGGDTQGAGVGVQVGQTSGDTPPDNGSPGSDSRIGAGSFLWTPPVGVGRSRSTPPPPEQGAPASGQRQGAASRGFCPRVAKPLLNDGVVAPQVLMALVPLIQETKSQESSQGSVKITSKSVLGFTVAERPTFWFYIPYGSTPQYSAKLTLQDENDNEVFQTSFKASENMTNGVETQGLSTPGVVGIPLPSTAPPLEVGKRYHWNFSIYCGESEEGAIWVDGWVERVPLSPALKLQLAAATPERRVALYGEARLWYDTITSLAQLRLQDPANPTLKVEWLKLLKSIDLDAIAPQPITRN